MNPAVAVLCGGLATRLGELAGGLPKSMIPVRGKPYLELVLTSFAERGFTEFVLLTGYRGEVIEEHFADGSRFEISIRYSRESRPSGTGGAVRDARGLLGERFVLTYGDVFRRFDYDRFVRKHSGNCLAVYERLTAGNSDVADGRVLRFDKNDPELGWVDAGFAVLETRVIELLPAEGTCSFEEIVYPELARQRSLECEIVDHEFFDIGTPDQLSRTRAALEGR
ncbi:MAG TPA: sugar phosphate nucleotidyltransferase [Thermoanaerobaculia bacterium]